MRTCNKTIESDRSLNRLIEVMYQRLFEQYHPLFHDMLMKQRMQGRNVLRKRLDESDLKRVKSYALMLADDNTRFHMRAIGLIAH